MIMRHKAKGSMVIVTICLVTQGSMQGVPECLDLAYSDTGNETLMQICKEIGDCNGGLQEEFYQTGEKKEDKLRDNLLKRQENVWAKRKGFQNTKIGNAIRYWIPLKGQCYFEESKMNQSLRELIEDKIDEFLQIENHTFYHCLGDPPAQECPTSSTNSSTTSSTTSSTRKATTRTTGRTKGVTPANETTTESDDSGDVTTVEIDSLMTYTVIGVFSVAAVIGICVGCYLAINKSRQEQPSKSSNDHSVRFSRATRSKSTVSKMSRKSGRSLSNVSRSSQIRRKSRRVSSESEDSSSSTVSVDFSMSTKQYERSPSTASGLTTQSAIGIVKALMKGAKTKRQIAESISKKENENALKKESDARKESLKKKRKMSKYDRV